MTIPDIGNMPIFAAFVRNVLPFVYAYPTTDPTEKPRNIFSQFV